MPHPTSPLQEAVHGSGLAHVLGQLVENPFLRPGGPEGQKTAGGPAEARIDAEGHPPKLAGQAALPPDPHFQQKELLEDQPEQSRSAPGGQVLPACFRRGEVGFLQGCPAVHEAVALQNRQRQSFRDAGEFRQDSVDQSPQRAGPQASGGLVDGNDSTHVDRALNRGRFVQDFELGIDDLQAAGSVGVKLELPVKDDLLSPLEDLALVQVFRVEPLAADQTGPVAGSQVEDLEAALARDGQTDSRNLDQYGGLGSRLKISYLAKTGAVLRSGREGCKAGLRRCGCSWRQGRGLSLAPHP